MVCKITRVSQSYYGTRKMKKKRGKRDPDNDDARSWLMHNFSSLLVAVSDASSEGNMIRGETGCPLCVSWKA
jgi:hypothetical protein